jgi:hypothetical protein
MKKGKATKKTERRVRAKRASNERAPVGETKINPYDKLLERAKANREQAENPSDWSDLLRLFDLGYAMGGRAFLGLRPGDKGYLDSEEAKRDRERGPAFAPLARPDLDGTATGKTEIRAVIRSSDEGTMSSGPAVEHVDLETGKRTPLAEGLTNLVDALELELAVKFGGVSLANWDDRRKVAEWAAEKVREWR